MTNNKFEIFVWELIRVVYGFIFFIVFPQKYFKIFKAIIAIFTKEKHFAPFHFRLHIQKNAYSQPNYSLENFPSTKHIIFLYLFTIFSCNNIKVVQLKFSKQLHDNI